MTIMEKPADGLDRRRFCGLAAAAMAGGTLGPAEAGTAPPSISPIVMMDAVELSGAIRTRAVSVREVMQAYLDHIDRVNPAVNAIVSRLDRDQAMAQAAARDEQLSRGIRLGWMHGFPQAIKDLSPVKGMRTTFGSPLFADHVASEDALFVARMRAAGAIIIGRTNTPEFGLGSHTYNPVHGATRNAYDGNRTAGGSSGGAAVALAMRMLPVADGSDYAGSLRNPAAFNNVMGLRPGFGRVPDPEGELFLSQFGVVGPMARNAADLAMLLSVQAGPDRRAPLSIGQDPVLFTGGLKRDFAGTRIGWLGDFNGHLPMEPGVMALCEASFKDFDAIGCAVEPVATGYAMEPLWQAAIRLRHWQVGAGLGQLHRDPVKRALMKPEACWEVEQGLALTAADIHAASVERSNWYRLVADLFQTYDFLLLPTAQLFPFDVGLDWPKAIDGRAMDSYHRWMEVTLPVTMSGCPAVSVPVGFDARGLPMGVQIIGPNHGEWSLLQLAHAYEQVSSWTGRHRPPALAHAKREFQEHG